MKASTKALNLIAALKAIAALSSMFLPNKDFLLLLDLLAQIEIIFQKASARSLQAAESRYHADEVCVDYIMPEEDGSFAQPEAWWVDQEF